MGVATAIVPIARPIMAIDTADGIMVMTTSTVANLEVIKEAAAWIEIGAVYNRLHLTFI